MTAQTGTRPADRVVAMWLFIVAALVFVMIIVGGLTRLTDSGLSITEWRPVTGAIPPLSDAGWERELALYRETTEYQVQNRGMSMAEFQVIYWWEWGHRFLGRLIGAAFALPLLVFAAMRLIRGWMAPRLVALFLLGGVQGAVGWWMVASGLVDRLDVSHYRLAVHLGLAFVLFGALIWTGLDAWTGEKRRLRQSWLVLATAAFSLGVFGQVILGAFVAGLDAGRIYTSWPLMDGGWLPPVYREGDLSVMALLEDRGAVQFHHRIGGYVLALGGAVLTLAIWRSAPSQRRLAAALGGVTLGQVVLGVVTLMLAAPVALSAAHQALAAILFGVAVVTTRRLAMRAEVNSARSPAPGRQVAAPETPR